MESFSADLTRFDFHVNRFLGSQDVRQMTAEEVGQYILLLLEAWTLHKGATLPNDMGYLCYVARSKKISPKVMKKFTPVTMDGEDGPEERLRNKRLFEEWQKAMNRYQKFSEGGRNSASQRASKHLGSTLEAPSDQVAAIPYQSIPDHSTTTQKDVEAAEKSGSEYLEAKRKALMDSLNEDE